MATRLINEVTLILEGEITDKFLIRLRIIDGQLADKKGMLTTFNEEILALIDVADIEADILESETISDKIAQMRERYTITLGAVDYMTTFITSHTSQQYSKKET